MRILRSRSESYHISTFLPALGSGRDTALLLGSLVGKLRFDVSSGRMIPRGCDRFGKEECGMSPEEKEPTSDFKVIDRRGFSSDGTRLSHEPEKAAPRSDVETEPAPSKIASEGTNRPIPEAMAEFESLVSYLSTSAMYQLGLLPGPNGERVLPDPFNARRTIDLLEVLQKKTSGNLTLEEGRLLEEVLFELRMSYVEVEKKLTTKPR